MLSDWHWRLQRDTGAQRISKRYFLRPLPNSSFSYESVSKREPMKMEKVERGKKSGVKEEGTSVERMNHVTPSKSPVQIKVEVDLEGHLRPEVPPTLEALMSLPPGLQQYLTLLKHGIESAAAFVCEECGIKFSSVSTLEAHRTFYCNKLRTKRNSSSGGEEPSLVRQASPARSVSPTSSTSVEPGQKRPAPSDPPGSPPSFKARRSFRLYACPHCPMSTDKRMKLNRHLRIHAGMPQIATPAISVESPEESSTSKTLVAQERYCRDCDIQFSSTKTFQAHKELYCKGRHERVASRNGEETSPALQSGMPMLLLPTTPPILIPYNVLQTGQFYPSSIPAPTNAYIIDSDGTIKPPSAVEQEEPRSQETTDGPQQSTVLSALTMVQSLLAQLYTSSTPPATERPAERSPNPEVPKPLDLSRPMDLSKHEPTPPREKEKKPERVAETSDAPETPQMQQGFPLLKSQLMFPFLGLQVPQNHHVMPTILPAKRGRRQTGGNGVIVKQGIIKCDDCSIVFCKVENYLVHKQHYCSGRVQGVRSKSPPTEKVEVCVACGLVCSSAAALIEHAASCSVKQEAAAKVELSVPPPFASHTSSSSGEEVNGNTAAWPCCYCSIARGTPAAAYKHLETHAGPRAFRCMTCGYRGNTLRGMRTHIRVHFEGRNVEVKEEELLGCIGRGELDDEPITAAVEPREEARDSNSLLNSRIDEYLQRCVPAAELESGLFQAHALPATRSSRAHKADKVYNCEVCPYSSSYPGNVVRHSKLVHDKSGSLPDAVEQSTEEIQVEVKVEPDIVVKEEQDSDRSESDSPETSVNHCKSCNITFTYLQTYLAHKKFYCTSSQKETVENA